MQEDIGSAQRIKCRKEALDMNNMKTEQLLSNGASVPKKTASTPLTDESEKTVVAAQIEENASRRRNVRMTLFKILAMGSIVVALAIWGSIDMQIKQMTA